MELQNSFVVPSDMETAWETLQNVEGLAPCVPGATLESSDGQNFTGSVKVKLGPVAMTYGGQAHFVSLDKENWTAVIEGSGKETKGTGTAKGLVTAKLTSEAPDRTRVDVNTLPWQPPRPLRPATPLPLRLQPRPRLKPKLLPPLLLLHRKFRLTTASIYWARPALPSPSAPSQSLSAWPSSA